MIKNKIFDFWKRRKGIHIAVIIGLILLALYAYNRRQYLFYTFQQKNINTVELNSAEPVLALFSIDTAAQNQLTSSFPHFKVILSDSGTWNINNDLITEIADSIPVLITVETWNGNKINPDNPHPLESLLKGSYDKAIQRLCATLIGEKPNVFIRFDPEMEVPVKNFPWQFYSPQGYIDAFRHFAKKCKAYSPQAKIVWGPAGFMGTEEFYPGDDVVDVISLTLQSDVEKMVTRYPSYTDIKTEVHRKMHRLRFFNKPIMMITSNKVNDKKLVYNSINAEIDTIAKYRNIAHDKDLWVTSDSVIKDRKFVFGLYDPRQLLLSDPSISLEHVFVDFGCIQSGESKRLLHDVFSRNHDAILTVEPWKDLSGKPDSNVLVNIVGGKYDSILRQLFKDISGTKHSVYLRFAHEMEIPITRYAWQSKDPIDYIKAYRYFMQFPQPFPTNVKRVWGPAGDRGSSEWYPGNDVVDFMSIAIYGLPDKDITDPEKQESFSTIFNRKSWRLRFIEKPLFITEFGVKGPEEYKMNWMEDAAMTLNKNPQVIGVNYFNMSDTPGAWGDIKEPDWSITPKTLHKFMEILN